MSSSSQNQVVTQRQHKPRRDDAPADEQIWKRVVVDVDAQISGEQRKKACGGFQMDRRGTEWHQGPDTLAQHVLLDLQWIKKSTAAAYTGLSSVSVLMVSSGAGTNLKVVGWKSWGHTSGAKKKLSCPPPLFWLYKYN